MANMSAVMPQEMPLLKRLLDALEDANGVGILEIVQTSVHSTSVDPAQTSAFVGQLAHELDVMIQSITDANWKLQEQQEIQLGALISASSLTARYVTHKQSFEAFLWTFWNGFRQVLTAAQWTKAHLGLKMVALMGCSRICECFGEHIEACQVVDLLQWLHDQLLQPSTDDQEPTQRTKRLHFLMRPTCEFLNVCVQTHVQSVTQSFLYQKLVPSLLRLVVNCSTQSTSEFSEENRLELVNTMAVLVERQLRPLGSAFRLLPMPSFVDWDQEDEEEEEQGDDTDAAKDMGAAGACGVFQDLQLFDDATRVLGEWTSASVKLRSASALALAILWRLALQRQEVSTSHKQSATENLSNSVDRLQQSLHSVEYKAQVDFEFTHVVLESLRDLLLEKACVALPDESLQGLYAELKAVMPRLATAIKIPNAFPKSSFRDIKTVCSAIRETLVEVFLAFMHHGCHAKHSPRHHLEPIADDLLGNALPKLADPRVLADALFVLHDTIESTHYQKLLGQAANLMLQALAQLVQYSKVMIISVCLQRWIFLCMLSVALNELDNSQVAAARILVATSRLAVASKQSLALFAEQLVTQILHHWDTKLAKSKALRHKSMEAIACLLWFAGPDAVDESTTVSFCTSLVVQCASSEPDSKALHLLQQLLTANATPPALSRCAVEAIVKAPMCLVEVFGANCAVSEEESPLFDEDVELLVLQIEILCALHHQPSLQTRFAPAKDGLVINVRRLHQRAKRQENAAIEQVCCKFLAAAERK